MADTRQVVSELIIRNGQANKTEVDEFGRHFQKAAKAAGDGMKIIDATANVSSKRIKASFDSIVASLDPLDKALHNIERTYARDAQMLDLAFKKKLVSEQEYTAASSRLTDKRIADIAREKTARMQAANTNNISAGSQRAAGLNAAFQFQDIGMMAVAGQNPIMTAVQQGSQLAGIMQQVKSEGGSAFAALRAGAMSMINTTSLLAIGLTFAVTAAVQLGIAWFNSGEAAEKTLEEQNELVDKLTDKYGTATGLLKQWNDERKRGEEQADVKAGIGIGRERLYGPLREAADMSWISTGLQLQDYASAKPEQVKAISDAYAEVIKKLSDSRDATREVEALKTALKAFGDEQFIVDAVEVFDDMADGMARAAEEADKLEGRLRQLIGIGGTMEGARLGQAGVSGRLRELQAGILGSEERNRDIRGDWEARRDYLRESGLTANEKTRRAASRWLNNPLDEHDDSQFAKKAASEKEQEAKAAIRLSDQLKKEAEARAKIVQGARDSADMAKLRVDTYGMEADAQQRLIDQLKIEQDLKSKGKDLTAEEAEAYRQAATAASEYGIQLDDLEKQQKELNEQQQFFGDLMMDGLNGMISGGEKLEDVLKKIGLALADAVLKAALLGQGPLASFFGWQPKEGQSVGGLFGDVFGSAYKKGPSAGYVNTAALAAGSGWGGLRNVTTGGMSASMATNAAAIRMIESGSAAGNYNALGAVLTKKNGSTDQALGAYQIMESNLPSWSRASFGRNIGRNEFLGNKAIQDRIFNDQFGSSIKRYGSNSDAASVWLTGRPRGFGGSNAAADVHGTTGSSYVRQFENNVQKLTGSMQRTTSATTEMGKSAEGAAGGITSMTDVLKQFPAAPGAPAGGGGGWGSLLGGMGSFMNNVSPAASSWIMSGGGMTGLWANGGAFPNGISGFSNSIVDRATPFMFARGAGIMGEAGPEAIMPLQRGPGGKLGVAMHGGGGVVIHNYADTDVKTRESNDNSGRMEIVIEERYASRINTRGTPLNKAVRNAAANPLKKR